MKAVRNGRTDEFTGGKRDGQTVRLKEGRMDGRALHGHNRCTDEVGGMKLR